MPMKNGMEFNVFALIYMIELMEFVNYVQQTRFLMEVVVFMVKIIVPNQIKYGMVFNVFVHKDII
jgi:hypothetical protein